MPLRDFFPRRRKSLTVAPSVVEAARAGQLNLYPRLGGTNQQVKAAWEQVQSASYGWMYLNQPSIRTVVDTLARNVAQIGLKTFERVSDDDRERITDHPAVETMRRPYEEMPTDRWVYNFVADFEIYDNAYAIKFRNANRTLTLLRVPPPYMSIISDTRYSVVAYRVWRADGTWFDVAPDDVIHWRGYHPDDPRVGASKLEALRDLIASEQATQRANTELMKSGLQKRGWVYRPLEAAKWSNTARQNFEVDLKNRVTRSDLAWPVLEEGMELRDMGVSPKDAEMLASRRFTVEEVARVYGIPLGFLGLQPATELGEQRRQLYADVLPPVTNQLQGVLTVSILEAEYFEQEMYYEFDLNEKLRGDLENRLPAMVSAAGRPIMTVNEVRARENLPAVEGGDAMTIPLNVMLEGPGSPALPAPNVMPPQDPLEPPQDGSHRELPASTSGSRPQHKAILYGERKAQVERRDRYAAAFAELLDAFFERQSRSSAGKALKAFDSQRWNRELAKDLNDMLTRTIEREGDVAGLRFGLMGFDTRQVRNYLQAMSEGIAESINDVTRGELSEAGAADVYARARNERAPAAAMTLATRSVTIAHMEAAKQSPQPGARTKTWIVTSDNSSHPELDGETVPLGASFSNGSDGPPADHPACQCTLEIN